MIRTPAVIVFLAFATLPTYAQEAYRLPPPEVVAIVDAPVPPVAHFSPDAKWILFVQSDPLPPIADLSRRMLRLGGTRIDPAANASFQTNYAKSLAFRPMAGKDATPIALPAGARLAGASWSHNSKRFAISLVTDGGTELWTGTVDNPTKLTKIADKLCAVRGRGYTWMPDGDSLLCLEVPAGRGAEPKAPAAPTGPNIQETSGNKSPVRTYQDLLTNPYDDALFEYYSTSQLCWVNPKTGETRMIGKPAMFGETAPSPDGRHILTARTHRPFSYLMPATDFPETVEVWTADGKPEYTVVEVPMAENIPIEGVRMGPRSVSWKPGEGATLVWAEALDGGDPKKKAEFRDKWVALTAPFDGKPRELCKLEQRARGVQWMENPNLMIASDYDRDRRWTRTRIFDVSKPNEAPVVLDDRSSNDRYKDPGNLVMRTDAAGRAIVQQSGPWVFRTGAGATPDGEMPFFTRQNLKTNAREELWRCDKGAYESVVDVIEEGVEKPAFLTRHETPDSPPNYRLRKVGGEITQLTNDTDPTPQIRGIKKQLVKYKRPDGVDLSATLYLPAGYKEGTRLPLVVWAYPLEFNDAATAGQVSGSPNRFTRMGGISHLFFLTQGYAVMDNATMPIVGDPETMNDNFLEQIVASAKAAIDKAAEMGVADPNKVGVGGHSYGAFMTANLLAHSDLFRAGIARSGAYNRTLTPFGFQSERRTIWEAPQVYAKVSPFMYANKINEPLLMIHGEADANPGTFPIQSERLFAAIKGNGGTARLVLLPKENHGYQARESSLHVLAEMIDWFDKYVKPDRAAPAEASGTKK
jgi:dipeptidyl aminopeptidase/acylaminoacyl peptidase